MSDRWGPSEDCEACGQTVSFGDLTDGYCRDCLGGGDTVCGIPDTEQLQIENDKLNKWAALQPKEED